MKKQKIIIPLKKKGSIKKKKMSGFKKFYKLFLTFAPLKLKITFSFIIKCFLH